MNTPKEDKAFRTTHNLPFLSAPWIMDGWQIYKIGTMGGQWRATKDTYDILSFLNDEPGNGHLEDVFEWFENSCKRDGKALRILEIMNSRFLGHLISKRGFKYLGDDHAIKYFK